MLDNDRVGWWNVMDVGSTGKMYLLRVTYEPQKYASLVLVQKNRKYMCLLIRSMYAMHVEFFRKYLVGYI